MSEEESVSVAELKRLWKQHNHWLTLEESAMLLGFMTPLDFISSMMKHASRLEKSKHLHAEIMPKLLELSEFNSKALNDFKQMFHSYLEAKL